MAQHMGNKETVEFLKSMFPSLPEEILIDVYNASHRNLDQAVQSLLEMAPTENAPAVSAPKPKAPETGESVQYLVRDVGASFWCVSVPASTPTVGAAKAAMAKAKGVPVSDISLASFADGVLKLNPADDTLLQAVGMNTVNEREFHDAMATTDLVRRGSFFGKNRPMHCAINNPHKLRLWIKTLTGNHYGVLIELAASVEDLKQAVQDIDGIPVDQQRIIFEGKQLEDQRKVTDYNIRPDSELHLVLRLRGGKPVIMVYSHEETHFSCQLTLPDFAGLSCIFPAATRSEKEINGENKVTWEGIAMPGAHLLLRKPESDKLTTASYLFYEFNVSNNDTRAACIMQTGKEPRICVPDASAVLQDLLCALGFTPREQTDMITYWLPKIEEGDYPFVEFQFLVDRFEKALPLEFTPKPQHSLRVFMVFRKLQQDTAVPLSDAIAEFRSFYSKYCLQPNHDCPESGNMCVLEWGGADATNYKIRS